MPPTMPGEQSNGKRFPLDILIVISCSIIAFVCIMLLPDGNIMRVIFGIPILVFFPGYAVVSVLWPEKYVGSKQRKTTDGSEGHGIKDIDTIERIAFSIGISIAIIPIIGLALNYLWSLTIVPIASSLLIVTLTFSMFGWYRRSLIHENNRYDIDFVFSSKPLFGEMEKTEMTVITLLVICIIISGSILAYLVITPNESGKYTEFYMLDQNRTYADIPAYLTINETAKVIIGITSHEQEMVDYTLVAGTGNITQSTQYTTWLQENNFNNQTTIGMIASLEHLETYEHELTFTFSEPGTYDIIFRLFFSGNETDYELSLRVNVE